MSTICASAARMIGLAVTLSGISLPAAPQAQYNPSSQVASAKVELAQAIPKTRRPLARQPDFDQQQIARINAWTVGLAAGRIEGAPLQFASELARVLDDGDNMRVLPIVTRGPFDNIYDLLYLRGVDAAIVYGDVLDYFRSNAKVGSLEQRVNYIMPLFPSEVHVLVRPEINKLEDLRSEERRVGKECRC